MTGGNVSLPRRPLQAYFTNERRDWTKLTQESGTVPEEWQMLEPQYRQVTGPGAA